MKIYEVGGSVRDKIIGVPSSDRDFVVMAPSFEDMVSHILKSGGRIYLQKPEYFSVRAQMPNIGDADFTLGRKEGKYTDGRRPDSVSVCSDIHEELARRDFAMNSIAVDCDTGEVIDPFNGREAIKNKIINCVGDPEQKFYEDTLRPFRAVRFAIQKNFYLCSKVRAAILKMKAEDFDNLPSERIMDEVTKMLEANTADACDLLFNYYKELGRVIAGKGIRFVPTTKHLTKK